MEETTITKITTIPIYLHDFETTTTFKRCRFLGQGSFAKCYAIMDIDTKELYAGKIVSKLTKKSCIQKVSKEIAIHKGLKHDNIVKFYNFFDDEHYIYIVLELCIHCSMLELQQKRIKITEYECRYYMMQIIRGVKYLHENGIIHRDLKLGNLFLDDKLHIKIGDFGLATCVEYENERKMTICGTPNYVAPEILQGNGHSYSVDIWSIGCVMYTLLVGTPPFETSSIKETYRKIKKADFINPTFLSKHAAKMIVALLLPNPIDRPSAVQLLDFEFMRYEFIPKQLPNSLLTKPPSIEVNSTIYNRQSASTATTITASEANGRSANKPTHNLLRIHYINDAKILYRNIRSLINCKPILLTADLHDMYMDPAARPLHWVSKWVDYSDKYGFGYQLCDDSIGVTFKDMTKIILLPNHITVQFIDINGSLSYMSTLDYDSTYEKKIKILLAFKRYMVDQLQMAGSSYIPGDSDKLSQVPHIHSWFRSSSCIAMYFSNGIVQFNFVDHIKIILCSRMNAITRMDERGRCHTYQFSTLATYGLSHDLYQKLRKIFKKIKRIL